MTVQKFQTTILDWYKTHRRDLPWRNTKNPYKILVSEIMLQQTQVARVIPKYEEFLKAFPTLEKLAAASDRKLLATWAGLGYWKRAFALKATAKKTMREHAGILPAQPKALEAFPGIGPYTARALACFAYNSTEAFLDTNIRRVYLHFFFENREGVPDKEILPKAQNAISQLRRRISVQEWHYALFDYGAIVLKNSKANHKSKHHAQQSTFKGSFRFFRAQVMHFLLSQPEQKATKTKIAHALQDAKSPYAAEHVLAALEKDNLLKRKNRLYSL